MYLGYLSMTYMLTWKFCPYLSANQRFSCCTLMLFKVQVVSPCIFLVEFTWRLMVWLSIFWMWVLYPLAVISRSTENQKCSQQLYSNYMYTMQMMHSNKNYFIKLLLHFSSFSFYFFPTFLYCRQTLKRGKGENANGRIPFYMYVCMREWGYNSCMYMSLFICQCRTCCGMLSIKRMIIQQKIKFIKIYWY